MQWHSAKITQRTMRLKPVLIVALALGVGLSSCNQQKAPETSGNPLLAEWNTPYSVPPFDSIKPEHYEPAFDAAMEMQNKQLEEIVASKDAPTFENTMIPFVFSGSQLGRVAGVFYNVEAAETSEQLQEIAKKVSPKLTVHSDNIYLNAALYDRLAAIPMEGLNEQQARLLKETLTDFKDAGVLLPEESKQRLREINERLSVLSLDFGNNTLAETNDFCLTITDSAQLKGLPQLVIDAAATTAKEKGLPEGQWVFTPHKPSMLPFLTYAENDSLRDELYRLYYSRGDRGNAHDNKAILTEIANLRLERAKLMGFPSHSAYTLARSMAKTPEAAVGLLEKLWTPALAMAKAERAELEKIKHASGSKGPLKASDWWYYAEKVRQSKYDLDEEALRPYLSLENVKNGVFLMAEKLYGLKFKKLGNEVPVYHPEVEAYEVIEENGNHLALIYLDFFPRAGKSSGAWCTTFEDAHRDQQGNWVPPVVSIVCNFTRPTGDSPALLLFDEVETLFHEFGHALHAFFSIEEYPGMGSTPRDFVETPSQLHEHWASHPEFLKLYAKHYKSGEVMPDSLIQKLTNSSHFNQGFGTVEYLAASLLDMSYHNRVEPLTADASSFERAEMDRYGLIPEILPRYRSTYFGHIFSGGYSSGYYSYIWAEAMDCDIWQAFVETGDIFNREVAKNVRDKILCWGNARDAADMFRDFRGRDVSIDGLLKNRGLVVDEAK